MASRSSNPLSNSLSTLLMPNLSMTDSLFNDMQQQFNRMVDSLWNMNGNMVGSNISVTSPYAMLTSVPKVELRQANDDLSVTVELPGVNGEDVDVRLEDNLLTISGEKKSETLQQTKGVHFTERSFGQFQRVIPLPFAPDPQQVQADFHNGVLTIQMQKQHEQRSHRIEVNQKESSGQSTGQQGQGGKANASSEQSSSSGSNGSNGSNNNQANHQSKRSENKQGERIAA